MPRCVVTRRVHCNAAHRLFTPRCSNAEHERTFGVCRTPTFRIRLWETDRNYVDYHGT